MSFELDEILKRTTSRYLATLWSFYRSYFSDDPSCLKFIYNCIRNEPLINGQNYYGVADKPGIFVADNGDTIDDSVFIPRRMLNVVERLVSAANDMDQIRRGKDVFKIVFLVTCVETLQQLSKNNSSKKNILLSFFNDYTSEEDKCFISKRFKLESKEPTEAQEKTFQQFIGVIIEYRNCAAHEGEYWNYCFNNNANREEWPILFTVKIDLDKFSRKNKRVHCFRTQISYKDFEAIFVRTCIAFIKNYVIKTNSVYL